ncbi:MAG TPA: hypothetical protein VJN65_04505 [Bacteroidota bacterium]|nr:hypothetical protein [Bacteroidota bacterium]
MKEKSNEASHEKLLELLGGSRTPTSEEFKQLVINLDSHRVLTKVFLLEGTPFVFEKSPMKYAIFREQVAAQFDVGSQDVCIVGSARLGFSPSAHQFGKPFAESADVDVVVISEDYFYRGSRLLFSELSRLQPSVYAVRPFVKSPPDSKGKPPVVNLADWKSVKEAIRNFVFENFNPGLLPGSHPLRIEIFDKISSTAGLFLALEPKVFVSKIRCRIFRNWKAAEDYYSNTLREARNVLSGSTDVDVDTDLEDADTFPAADPPVATGGPTSI